MFRIFTEPHPSGHSHPSNVPRHSNLLKSRPSVSTGGVGGKALATVLGWESGDTDLGYSPTSSTLSTHSTICLAPKRNWIAPLDPLLKLMISGCVFLFLLSKGIFGK